MTKPAPELTVVVILLATALLLLPPGRTETGRDRMSIDRIMDKVVIEGKELPELTGRPIRGLRLMAIENGRPKAVPFQVDERTPEGDYVMKRPDGTEDRDADQGRLDQNDELVFMAMDAGDHGSADDFPERCSFHEIKLIDPQSGAAGWVYLVYFPESPSPLSTKRYMKYMEHEDSDEVVSPYYTLHFPKKNVFISGFMVHRAAGGNDTDIMDRIKMRSGVEVLAGSVKLLRTEEDFSTEVLGVIKGPVRVIRQTSTRLNLLLSLKSPSVVVDGSFYPCSFEFPSLLSIPFRMDMVASDAYIRQGWDLNRNALGMKFYSNIEPQGVTLDGSMSKREKKLASSRKTLQWALATGEQGTFMFRGVWDRKAPFRALLYYEDNLSRKEPPEEDPGVMGFAYKLVDLLKMGSEKYSFNIENYVVPGFEGDRKRALRVFYHPLEVEIN
ncbi:MAG: hypothetical protein R6V10_14460 [bacterium]